MKKLLLITLFFSLPLYSFAFEVGETASVYIPSCAVTMDSAGTTSDWDYYPAGYYGSTAFLSPTYSDEILYYHDGTTAWYIAIIDTANVFTFPYSTVDDPTGAYGDLSSDCPTEDAIVIYTPPEEPTATTTLDLSYTNYLLSIIASSTATTTNVMYGDWLIMNLWILFFLSLIGSGFFFQLFRKRTGYDRALK